MPQRQHPNIMISRFNATPETFDHLLLGIPAVQYRSMKQKLLISTLDVIMTKLYPLGEHNLDANRSKSLRFSGDLTSVDFCFLTGSERS